MRKENLIRLDETFLTERGIYDKLEKLSDRELQEFQASVAFKTLLSTKRTAKNVAFFFYLTLVSMFIVGFLFMVAVK